MSDRITVTVTDHSNGDSQTAELPRDSYIIVCGEHREVAHTQQHANGTVQITVKPVTTPEPGSGDA